MILFDCRMISYVPGGVKCGRGQQNQVFGGSFPGKMGLKCASVAPKLASRNSYEFHSLLGFRGFHANISNVQPIFSTSNQCFERSKFQSNVRSSSRTFEIPVERSKFWWNVPISGRTFEVLVERSTFVIREKIKSVMKGQKTGFRNFSLKYN